MAPQKKSFHCCLPASLCSCTGLCAPVWLEVLRQAGGGVAKACRESSHGIREEAAKACHSTNGTCRGGVVVWEGRGGLGKGFGGAKLHHACRGTPQTHPPLVNSRSIPLWVATNVWGAGLKFKPDSFPSAGGQAFLNGNAKICIQQKKSSIVLASCFVWSSHILDCG